MRALQIGVVGSMADLQYSARLEKQAAAIGLAIAKAGCVLVFGAEKDSTSLPTIAALSAREEGGLTVGITYEKGLAIFVPESATIVVATGMVRGGGREMAQALSCDGIIAISGGSGTLNELTVAYQANIPVVVIGASGGWSEKLADSYLDARQRYAYEAADDADDALEKVLKMIKSRQRNN